MSVAVMGTLSLSNLFSSSKTNEAVCQLLTFRPSPEDGKTTIIQREGYHGAQFPLYTLTAVKGRKANLQLSRVVGNYGHGLQQTIIGLAKFHSFSGNIDLTLPGQSICLFPSSVSSTYSFIGPNTGKLKWKSDSLRGHLELVDSAGLKLARYKSGTKLEVLVPCDDYFLDMVVFTGMAVAKKHDKESKELEAVMEVVSGVSGG